MNYQTRITPDHAVQAPLSYREQIKAAEALLENQPAWARHDRPNLEIAWDAAEAAGLNVSTRDIETRYPATVAILTQDRADIEALGVRATPTFYLDSRQLTDVSFQSLTERVRQAVTESS